MSREDHQRLATFDAYVAASVAAPSVGVDDHDVDEEENLFLGMNVPAMPKEEVAADDEADLHIRRTSLVRNGSNGSPVCVTSFFDHFMGISAIGGNVEVSDDIYIGHPPSDEESIGFVDPDMLEEAISKLCDSVSTKPEKKKQGMFGPCRSAIGSVDDGHDSHTTN